MKPPQLSLISKTQRFNKICTTNVAVTWCVFIRVFVNNNNNVDTHKLIMLYQRNDNIVKQSYKSRSSDIKYVLYQKQLTNIDSKILNNYTGTAPTSSSYRMLINAN